MMAQWILLSVVAFITNNAIADVLVQPGYGQPHSIAQMEPIIQPLQAQPHLTAKTHHPELFDPGYHIELHPVYTHQHPSDIGAYSFMQHQVLPPYMSKAAIRRLNSGKLGGLGLVGLPQTVADHYLPLAVHRRHRRSSSPESGSNEHQREKRDKNAMATKSSLNDNTSSVVDLGSPDGEATKNLDEKNVKVRQSKSNEATNTGTLLGLNPSKMYPLYQYRSVLVPPQSVPNSHQQVTGEIQQQTSPQINYPATTQVQTPSQAQATSTMQAMVSTVNSENVQHATLLQHAAPQQYQESGASHTLGQYGPRNFPDPRPNSAASGSTKVETSSNLSEPSMFTAAKQAGVSDDKEIVGTHLRNLHKFSTVKHIHHHATFDEPSHTVDESQTCTCTKPGNVVQNRPTCNLEFPNNAAQQVVLVYQVPAVQATNYPTSLQYAVLPQTSGNPVANYGLMNPPSSSFNGCLQYPNQVPTATYQLV